MSKKNKSRKTPTKEAPTPKIRRRRKQPINWKRTLMVGFVGLAMFAFIFTSIPVNMFPKKKKTISSTTTTSPSTTTPSENSLVFKKEGTLNLVKADGTPIRTIDIEVAKTEMERNQGMMHRRTMDDDTGMLFLFDKPEPQSFWMKNTYVSLDIIYINAKKEIVTIHKNAVPLSEQNLLSTEDAQYVLEVPAGYTEGYNIEVGDKIDFELF